MGVKSTKSETSLSRSHSYLGCVDSAWESSSSSSTSVASTSSPNGFWAALEDSENGLSVFENVLIRVLSQSGYNVDSYYKFLQGRATTTPSNFLNFGCYRVFLACFFECWVLPFVKNDFPVIFKKKWNIFIAWYCRGPLLEVNGAHSLKSFFFLIFFSTFQARKKWTFWT